VSRHFSQRRVEIEEQALALVGAEDGLSRVRCKELRSRPGARSSTGLMAAAGRTRLAPGGSEHGLGASELLSVTKRGPQPSQDPDLAVVSDRLSGPTGLTERHNTFARRHALAELAGAFEQGVRSDWSRQPVPTSPPRAWSN
jgi:hypothetical protein